MVEDTIGPANAFTCGRKSAKKPLRMELKMCVSVWSVAVGRHITLKWRTKRGVTGFRPPPGGAAATTSAVFSMSFQNRFDRS